MSERINRPEVITHVSRTQLSIARLYGGIKYNGAEYHYDAETDTLTRKDIWRSRLATDKAEAKKIAKEERAKWDNTQKSFNGF